MRRLYQEVQEYKGKEFESKKAENKEQEINRRASLIIFLIAFRLPTNWLLRYTHAFKEDSLLLLVNCINQSF